MSKKMDPKVKRKWLAALRGGQYRQGKGMLYTRKDEGKCGFCCLGVLMAVQGGEQELRRKWTRDKRMTEYLPDAYRDGLVQEQAHILATMNDDGKTFSKIAKYIAKHL